MLNGGRIVSIAVVGNVSDGISEGGAVAANPLAVSQVFVSGPRVEGFSGKEDRE